MMRRVFDMIANGLSLAVFGLLVVVMLPYIAFTMLAESGARSVGDRIAKKWPDCERARTAGCLIRVLLPLMAVLILVVLMAFAVAWVKSLTPRPE